MNSRSFARKVYLSISSSLLLGILVLSSILSVNAATQYVGYTASNLGSDNCGPNCVVPGATTRGIGAVFKVPNGATALSSIYFRAAGVGNNLPTRADIGVLRTSGSGPVTSLSLSSTQPCGANNAANCPFVDTASCNSTACKLEVDQILTLSGLTLGTTNTGADNTILLPTPLSVTPGQWIGVVFQSSQNLNPILMGCGGAGGSQGARCGSLGGPQVAYVQADLEVDFTPDEPPTLLTQYPTMSADLGLNWAGFLVGASFTVQETPTGNPTPSPYGSNPAYYPCCGAVTAPSLQGAYLRAPDVDSYPLILLFIVLLALTLGSYLVLRARQGQGKKSRQYEIHI